MPWELCLIEFVCFAKFPLLSPLTNWQCWKTHACLKTFTKKGRFRGPETKRLASSKRFFKKCTFLAPFLAKKCWFLHFFSSFPKNLQISLKPNRQQNSKKPTGYNPFPLKNQQNLTKIAIGYYSDLSKTPKLFQKIHIFCHFLPVNRPIAFCFGSNMVWYISPWVEQVLKVSSSYIQGIPRNRVFSKSEMGHFFLQKRSKTHKNP